MPPRKQFSLAVAVLLVLGIAYSGSAFAEDRPSGKGTPNRNLRSTTDPQAPDVEASSLRMRVETRQGVLVVYDAASPSVGDVWCSGYIGYWWSARGKTQYIFPSVLQDEADLGAMLLALERDLGVDLEALAERNDRIDEVLSALPEP